MRGHVPQLHLQGIEINTINLLSLQIALLLAMAGRFSEELQCCPDAVTSNALVLLLNHAVCLPWPPGLKPR